MGGKRNSDLQNYYFWNFKGGTPGQRKGEKDKFFSKERRRVLMVYKEGVILILKGVRGRGRKEVYSLCMGAPQKKNAPACALPLGEKKKERGREFLFLFVQEEKKRFFGPLHMAILGGRGGTDHYS